MMTSVAITAGGKYEYEIMFAKLDTSSLHLYANKEQFDVLCKDGCVNYNKKWSCPPFAPAIEEFTQDWTHLYAMFMCINMAQFMHIKNNYLQIKAANSILKSRADKFLRNMAGKYGKYISTGSCRLCKPCKLKSNMPCAKPESMTYSFEAMGVDVAKLVADNFNRTLLWYRPEQLPTYTSVASGLLTNAELAHGLLIDEYRKLVPA